MAELNTTAIEDIPKIYAHLKGGFSSGKSKSVAYRKQQLLQLMYLLDDNKERFQDALYADLRRPTLESDFAELGPTINEVKTAYDSVEKWARTERTPFDWKWWAMSPAIRKEPKGVVLIIAPYNYPLFSGLGPMAGAIAAGNAVLLKPSEQTVAVDTLLAELFPLYLDQDLYQIVNGGVPETTRVLELQWDHILYTGSGRVARIIGVAAAKNLTPFTSELGGKNPAVIDPKCDLEVAVKRLWWGRILNGGQLCMSPDYVLVPREFQDTLVEKLIAVNKSFYPSDPRKEIGHMISEQHTLRIKGLLDATKGTIVFGGEVDVADRYIAPTLVRDVKGDDSLLSEEIFGPVLAIIPVDSLDEAINFINERDHPLTLYVFSKDAAFKRKVFDNTQSGSCVANDTILHCGASGLPLGGTGPSGSGYHTGKHGFDMFTHLRATIDSPSWMEFIMGGRYPPYLPGSADFLKKTLFPRLPARRLPPPDLSKLAKPSA